MNITMDSETFLRRIANQAVMSPLWTVFGIFLSTIFFMRFHSGLKRKLYSGSISELRLPVILPYWIPYIGHVLEYGWSLENLLARGRDANNDGIFGLKLFGNQHYFVMMPSLTKQYFLQRPAVLNNSDFLDWIHEKVFNVDDMSKIAKDDFSTVHRSLNSLMKEPFLSTATNRTARFLEQRTSNLVSLDLGETQSSWEKAAGAVVKGDHVEVDLWSLILYYVGDIASGLLMGDAFRENNPQALQDLWAFDSSFNTLLLGVSGITPGLSKAKAARDRVNLAITEWNQAVLDKLNGQEVDHKWGDLSDVSDTMRVRIKALDSINSDESFSAASNLALYWGIMVNANKVVFWMLLNIISRPDLLERIQTELAPFARVSRDGGSQSLKLDMDNLLGSCPLLKATFLESMRLYTSGVLYKKVYQDLTLNESPEDAATFGKLRAQSYLIPSGSYLVISSYTMQTDARLWKEPDRFDPERFHVVDEKDPGRVRAEYKHLNPWGGGPSVCKGRLFAEREVLMFVAGILACWDFSPVGGKWVIPGKVNGTGTANPKSKIRVQMRRRV